MKRLTLFLLLFLSIPSLLLSAEAPTDATKVFSIVRDSVFVILSYNAQGKLLAQGSGVAIAPNSVITNLHVVGSASKVRVRSGGSDYLAILSLKDPVSDLAQLFVPRLVTKPVRLQLAYPDIGSLVFSVGAPHGLEMTISEGIVSGHRTHQNIPLIQTSAAISPGSSGGGLFNRLGELVGITTWQFVEGQNLNFAVASLLIDLLPESGQREPPPSVPERSDHGAATSAPLIDGKWYVFFVGDTYLILLDPTSYFASGSLVSFDIVTVDFSGQYRGEKSHYRVQADCGARVTRGVSDVTVSSWTNGEFKKRWTPVQSWKAPQSGSVLAKEMDLACFFLEKGGPALTSALSRLHDKEYETAKMRGIPLHR